MMMMMSKKVKYIDDSNYRPDHLVHIENFPEINEIYTIRQKQVTGAGQIGYILQEIVNPLMPNGMEPSFNSRRFIDLGSDEQIANLVNTEVLENI